MIHAAHTLTAKYKKIPFSCMPKRGNYSFFFLLLHAYTTNVSVDFDTLFSIMSRDQNNFKAASRKPNSFV